MANFGLLAAEIDGRVWGTPANFNGFRVSAYCSDRRRSTEANQTLHDVWPCAGLVYNIHIFGGSCPLMEFCHVQNSLCVQVLRSPILAALLHGTRAVGVSQTAAWYLHASGRPSRLTSGGRTVYFFISLWPGSLC